MKRFVQILVSLAFLAVMGWLRMPLEQSLSEDMRARQILPPLFDLQSRAELKQKSFAASYGSFRPTMAAVMSLNASRHHVRSEWEELEAVYNDIVLLDPGNRYYWDMAGWHMAYNAATASLEDKRLPPIRRQRRFRDYMKKGSAFYDRGIAANPKDLAIRMMKVRLWSSPFMQPDYQLVTETLERALVEVEMSEAEEREVKVQLFYALLRLPDRAQESYDLGRALFDDKRHRRFPSLVNGLYALQLHPDVKTESPLQLHQLYKNGQDAYLNLRNYWRGRGNGKPLFGLEDKLRQWENRLEIADEKRLFPQNQRDMR